jgi:hypothetical protein
MSTARSVRVARSPAGPIISTTSRVRSVFFSSMPVPGIRLPSPSRPATSMGTPGRPETPFSSTCPRPRPNASFSSSRRFSCIEKL